MKMQVINPATEEPLGEFDIADKSVVAAVVSRARTAFVGWKGKDISEREAIIKKFGELLASRKSEVARLISREMGKPIVEAEGEVDGAVGEVGWFLAETRKAIADEAVDVGTDNVSARVAFEPVGVVGLITPWNFPIDTPLWKIIPALLTGNAVVFKPSELATLCELKIGELLAEAGVPEGVFSVVTGDGSAGRALIDSKIDMVSFTGSSAVGKEVMSRAGKELKKTVLELGGSDPFIVFEDAIFEQAVNGAVFGRFLNCGQVCTSAKRIFVQQRLYDSFVNAFVERVKALKVGEPLDRTTEIGPLVSKKQLETLERQFKDAVVKGARVLCGGKRPERKGFFFEPTVLVDVKPDMAVLKEEVFGPIACVMPFRTIEEAIGLANRTDYGLGASVWTQSKAAAERAAKAVESGMVWVNDFGTPYPQCPQGGIKASGIGRELSRYGIREFCNMKTIVKSADKSVRKPWWFPYR
jgi:acyl-CoA reductase-like NAD-dependent aldehyde dehydrogenase